MDEDVTKRAREALTGTTQIQKAPAENDRLQAALGSASLRQYLIGHPEVATSATQQIARYFLEIDKRREAFIGSIDLEKVRKFTQDMDALQIGIATAVGKLALASHAITSYAERVVLPKLSAADQIANGLNKSLQNMLQAYDARLPGIHQAMISMRSPWIDALHAERSIRGFSEVQIIGQALNTLPAFDVEFSDLLRADLGDWRDPVAMPDHAFAEPSDRTAIYVEHGLNTELTDFPEDAFLESISIAGLKREPPALIALYGSPVPALNIWDEEQLARNNEAHNWLQRLEMQIRNFINNIMTAAVGDGWEKHRLPNGFYDNWVMKKQKAESAGGPSHPLIAYADFTDYCPLICRKDNWPLFEQFFGRVESLRESFQRLYPIRIGTMHARMITQDDQLFLFVEARRLMNAIMSAGSKA